MFKKILVANRGEIAARIISACKEMGIKTVAIYSEADKDALHVALADEAICIGPSPSSKSYLNITNIITAAKITDSDAIHPGYGFLAENPYFAEICQAANLNFIGPRSQTIKSMGEKAKAKELMKEAGMPVIPGSVNVLTGTEEAVTCAGEIGYPVIFKAAAGGGGRGMRIAHDEKDLVQSIQIAKNEAEMAFANKDLYLEKYIEEPRHIEIQILADKTGQVIHLGDRDCSLQRRHQKLLEEAPASSLPEEIREEMARKAVEAAKYVGYLGAGTVEFLLDKDNNFYFMEMNTRLQVEHPVTEMITGIDIVKEQIKIAMGYSLSFKQEDISFNGHALECRINAEDPNKNFLPSPGQIEKLRIPGGFGVRFDTDIYEGYQIPSYYDSLIGKVIVWDWERNSAIEKMVRVLNELVIEGIKTTIPFHLKILENAFYRKGEFYTNFLQRRILKK